MRRLLAVLVAAGLAGCGSSGAYMGVTGSTAMCEGTYTPAAYEAQAQAAMGDLLRLHVGAGVSAVWPEDNSLDNTYMIDIMGQLDLIGGLVVEASLGYKTYDYYDTVLTDNGELTVKPLYATALYSKGAGPAKFYVGGGLQWEINDFDEISGLTTDDNVGFHGVVGVNLSSGRFSLQVEARYTFTDITIDYTNPMEPDIEISGDELNARIKFLMNF
ncbi:MAG: hypothetical protein JW909_14010 [Planctomycetes bacterium]|nr:hypothetical protein [Planctomycetota bacterium]